jgi:hypothetical protein
VCRLSLSFRTRCVIAAIALITSVPLCNAQDTLQDSIQALQKQTSEIRALLEEMKAEAAELRRQLEITREQLRVAGSPASLESAEGQARQEPLQKLEEEQQLLNAKLEEQSQTKVESASKYRVRLSGAVLVNLLSTRGTVDNLDFPNFVLASRAIYSPGSFAASVRQSLLGLEIFGPEIRGARVSADVQMDFAGGFPNAPDGVTFPLPRLRTAMVRLSSPTTTIAAGQDAPFFSPLSPTSVASISVPALSYSGNLWTWIPQARIERRLNLRSDSHLIVQGGILDPLTGEPPYFQFFRVPQAGESSRQPAYATRVAWSRHVSGGDLTIGSAGYYSRQSWGFERYTDGWAGTSDWIIPVAGPFEFSGEFYYGRAVGGLGGGLGRSVVMSGPITDPLTEVKALHSTGGWAQLKFRQTEKLEWNGVFGQDNVLARDLRLFPLAQQTYSDPSIARNRSSLVNFVYRPRSDVLLSLEYHRIRTFRIYGQSDRADQVNLTMGVVF